MLRILIIDESRARAAEFCAGLVTAGHQVAAVLPSVLDLTAQIEAIKPDIILNRNRLALARYAGESGGNVARYAAPGHYAHTRE